MKIVTIIGARPQFIKAAVVSRAITAHNQTNSKHKLDEKILHTGQHYDQNMNDVFFQNMGIKNPDWQLKCGSMVSNVSNGRMGERANERTDEQANGRTQGRVNEKLNNGSNTKMLSEMLIGIEKALIASKPDCVLVYGDTNSTLAGALVASQLHIPVLHVEAGLRSFNKQMPEEINRILTDHLSTRLFCPTSQSILNLTNEGITKGVYFTGDVMYDATQIFGEIAEEKSTIIATLGLQPKNFRLCTVHRAGNTNDPERLTQIIHALIEIATPDCPIILPLHPRTKGYLTHYNLNATIASNPSLRLIDPVDYLDMVMLEKNAATILTDSGGIQKEAYFYRTPCITLRDETEWTETVDAGWNQLAGYRTEKVLQCLKNTPAKYEITDYGDGHASEKIVQAIAGIG